MFLAQVLSADGSCQQAVNDAMVKRIIGGLKPGSTDTGGVLQGAGTPVVADDLDAGA